MKGSPMGWERTAVFLQEADVSWALLEGLSHGRYKDTVA